jgi:hypothetical protein
VSELYYVDSLVIVWALGFHIKLILWDLECFEIFFAVWLGQGTAYIFWA